MTAKLIIYRLISFILLPIAGINGFNIIRTLPAAVGSPLMLCSVFIASTLVIYTFASFTFFIRGVQNGKMLQPYIKDLVKVNAWIDVVLAALITIAAISYFISPAIQKNVLDYFTKTLEATNPGGVNKEALVRLLRGVFIFGGFYGAALFFHIIVTLQLLKEYNGLFVAS